MIKISNIFPASMIVPTLLLLVGGISYGSLFSANKRAIDAGFPFLSYAFWQVLLAAILLLIISSFTAGLPRLNKTNLNVFSFVAVVGLILPLLVITAIADKLPPGVVTLCAALIPAFTYILALSVRVEKMRLLSIGGVILGFGSVLLIVLPRESLPIEGSWVWVIFSLLMPVSLRSADQGLLAFLLQNLSHRSEGSSRLPRLHLTASSSFALCYLLSS